MLLQINKGISCLTKSLWQTGGQAGLVGYEEGGLLTNAFLKKPSAILLLDEIEKAHQ